VKPAPKSPRAANPTAAPPAGGSARKAKADASRDREGRDRASGDREGETGTDADAEAPPDGGGGAKLSVNDLFRLLDSNQDGTLTRAEVVAGCDKLALTEDEAGALFAELDADGSGTLARDEVANMFGSLGKLWDAKKAQKFLAATAARWDAPAVQSPKLTEAAANASPRYLDKNHFKIKGAAVLAPVEFVPKKAVPLTDAATKAAPKYLQTNHFKVPPLFLF
jgi:Ca2+-binding EF-hand superfamily protein